MNFAMRSVAPFHDRRWDDGTQSRPTNEFGLMVSHSWTMGLEFSAKSGVPAAGGGGHFSSFDRTHWDHASTSWSSDRGMSSLFTDTFEEPETEPIAPMLRLVPRPAGPKVHAP